MTIRALLSLLLAGCMLAPSAAAYGTTTTYPGSAGGTPPGTWADVSAAADASDGGASATLAETDAGGIAAVVEPANGEFTTDASGWSATDENAPLGLCTVVSAHTASGGDPPGAIRATFGTALGLFGLVNCTSTWRSPAFTWNEGVPADVAFSLRRNVDLGVAVQLASADITVRLVDETDASSAFLVTEHLDSALLGGSASGWGTLTATGLGPEDVVPGHSYHVEIETRFGSAVALLSGLRATYDDVALRITPADQRALGTLDLGGVPPGSTHTLELRGRTSGEPFEVQVWDGAGWTTRATLTATSDADLTYGLTAAEWNGGDVRVRFRDAAAGPDATKDVLSLDYARVVATGGISVAGPAAVPLTGVTLDGSGSVGATGTLGPVEVVDEGGDASGWTLELTATRFALDGQPDVQLPANALAATPGAPGAPDGDDLAGVSAAPPGVVLSAPPTPLMSAAPGSGVGRFVQSTPLTLTVPVDAMEGSYRSTLVLTAS